MKRFNLSTRILMFAICISMEYDLKKYIINCTSEVDFSQDMISKAKFRNPKIEITNISQVLDQIDLGDYITIISSNPYKFKCNNEQATLLFSYFEKIIPVRNRVMHTKPLELGDRSILQEVVEQLDLKICWINWNETINTRNILNEDPSKLISRNYTGIIEYKPQLYHNLPEPEFDDTGYIGRKQEIIDIKSLIYNKRYQIITIVGNGGLGKTAIAVKTLYEIIDDPKNEFDAVLWISLKTRTLSKGEFVTIENSIKDIPNIYLFGLNSIIAIDGLSPEENLINFMTEFKVLLVLDNLETVNNEDINSFIKKIPENSKVLITSRHGIGELEYRYNLQGMNSKDSIVYFRELSRYYGIELFKKSDDDIKDLINKHLYSNPLSIKWFISGVFNGMDERSLIAKKDELIEFCMSNVYSKLSQNAKNILQLFLIENKRLCIGEIDYFLNTDDVVLRKAINELLLTNMVKLSSGYYLMNDMARDYLSIYHAPDNDFVVTVLGKRRSLNTILQEISVRSINDPFNPKSICANLKDENRKLASYYLVKALNCSANAEWEDAFKFIDKACTISPDYFEVYKIKAFIFASKNEIYGALNNYQTAIDMCDNDFEKSTVLYLFAVFHVIKLTEYEKALELIVKAEECCPNQLNILLEKSRILTFLGQYSDAEEILKKVELTRYELDLKNQNILSTREADLFRRQAENYDSRNVDKKLNLYKKGISAIEKVSKIDTRSYLTMTNILKDCAYLFFDENVIFFLIETLEKHYNSLKSLNHANLRKMKEIIESHRNEIDPDLYGLLEIYINDYTINAESIKQKNQGIIISISEHYGFIANSTYKRIYYGINNFTSKFIVGDLVEFEIYENHKGVGAKNIKIVVQNE